MKKKFWLILYHLGGSVILLLLLYTSLQGLTTVTLCLAIPVLAASIIEAKFEWKFLRENPEIKRIQPIGSQKHSDIFVVLFWW